MNEGGLIFPIVLAELTFWQTPRLRSPCIIERRASAGPPKPLDRHSLGEGGLTSDFWLLEYPL